MRLDRPGALFNRLWSGVHVGRYVHDRGLKQSDCIGSEDCSDTGPSGQKYLGVTVVLLVLPGCGFQGTATVGVSSLIGSAW